MDKKTKISFREAFQTKQLAGSEACENEPMLSSLRRGNELIFYPLKTQKQ